MKATSKQRKRSKRSVRLTDAYKSIIRTLINKWPENRRLTWEDVIKMAEEAIGNRWTRQALCSHEELNAAYETAVQRYTTYRLRGPKKKVHADETEVLRQRSARLAAEIDALKETLRKSDDRLVRYLGNAIRHGITQEMLEAPLIPIDRGRTTTD